MTTAARTSSTATAAVVAAAAYAALRLLWEVRPPRARLSPIGTDLVGIDGWAAVGMCLAAALAAGALVRPTAVGLALGLAVVSDVYSRRVACAECGHRVSTWTSSLRETPDWVYAAAYVSVAGFLTRVLAQAVVGFDRSPTSSGSSLVHFEVAVGLAGTALPLALVHRWGRWFPRWLVLAPGVFTSAGVVVYFGVLLVQMVGERLAGRNPFPPNSGLDLPEVFFWVAVPAYLVWGIGMAIAALFYFRTTRRHCETCGH